MVTTRDSNAPTGDRRVRRTQAALQRTLIQLVEDRDLSQISVADVAERAGVSRSTFYDHYRDVHELAEAACTAMIDDLIESLPSPGPDSADPTQDATQSLRAFFANLAEHAGLYRSLLGPQEAHASSTTYAGVPPRPSTSPCAGPRPATNHRRRPPRRWTSPTTCPPRSPPERSSAWPSTGSSADACGHRPRWPP
ncbi:TetR/AcrR family transcriptional regulator [Nonomuraea recticatena]|uniref:TetR/AcrR family transcriptional regulator n=1 Tax=Nonomuraea recticatena TaxID=46178 RepID=UPI0036146BE6